MGLFYRICKRERENYTKWLNNIPVRIGNSGADWGMHTDTNKYARKPTVSIVGAVRVELNRNIRQLQ